MLPNDKILMCFKQYWTLFCEVATFSNSFIERLSVSGTILLVKACKYMRSSWHKMSSIFVYIYESTKFGRLKSKAEIDKCTLSASWMLTERFMTLMNTSSNRGNHNRLAKVIKENEKSYKTHLCFRSLLCYWLWEKQQSTWFYQGHWRLLLWVTFCVYFYQEKVREVCTLMSVATMYECCIRLCSGSKNKSIITFLYN